MGLDLRRYACGMVMADSAFERVDVRLFKHGIDYDVGGACVAISRNEFEEFADTKTFFFHFFLGVGKLALIPLIANSLAN